MHQAPCDLLRVTEQPEYAINWHLLCMRAQRCGINGTCIYVQRGTGQVHILSGTIIAIITTIDRHECE